MRTATFAPFLERANQPYDANPPKQETLLQKHWHLFTPVLLTLLDEGDSAVRVRALGALQGFWVRCPADLMRRTGLAQVIEDAVFPAVLYLPSLTPEDESLAVLGAAYPALMTMAGIDPDVDATACGSAEGGGAGPTTFTQAQRKLLDRIIREGILVGYHHASEYMRLVELLCEQLRRFVDGMGILAIKHLKVRTHLHIIIPNWAMPCQQNHFTPTLMRKPHFPLAMVHPPFLFSHVPPTRPRAAHNSERATRGSDDV